MGRIDITRIPAGVTDREGVGGRLTGVNTLVHTWSLQLLQTLGVRDQLFDLVTRGSRLKIDWCFANWMLF